MNIHIQIMHAAFEPARRTMLGNLLQELQRDMPPGTSVRIEEDTTKRGAAAVGLACWRAGLERSSAGDVVVVMNDDAELGPDFHARLRAALEAWPDAIVSGYANHPAAASAPAGYTTPEGLTSVCAAMPRALVDEYLTWRARTLAKPTTDDGDANLFAMATGRRIHVVPLVDHGAPTGSLCGNDQQPARRATVAPPAGWTPPATLPHLGRTYENNQFLLLANTHPARWRDQDLVRKAYAVARDVARAAEPR